MIATPYQYYQIGKKKNFLQFLNSKKEEKNSWKIICKKSVKWMKSVKKNKFISSQNMRNKLNEIGHKAHFTGISVKGNTY